MANFFAISSRFAMAAERWSCAGGTNGAGGAAMGKGTIGLGVALEACSPWGCRTGGAYVGVCTRLDGP